MKVTYSFLFSFLFFLLFFQIPAVTVVCATIASTVLPAPVHLGFGVADVNRT